MFTVGYLSHQIAIVVGFNLPAQLITELINSWIVLIFPPGFETDKIIFKQFYYILGSHFKRHKILLNNVFSRSKVLGVLGLSSKAFINYFLNHYPWSSNCVPKCLNTIFHYLACGKSGNILNDNKYFSALVVVQQYDNYWS